MAKLIYALNQSLDGFVDHDAFAPEPALFRHFIDDVRNLAGMIYGRRMYEVMRYWDEDQADWDEAERAYAAAWTSRPKWVVSRTLTWTLDRRESPRNSAERIPSTMVRRSASLPRLSDEISGSPSVIIDFAA